MTPLGGAQELDAASDTIQAGYRLPAGRLADLLRGGADTAALYERLLEAPATCGHLWVIADEIEAGKPYDPLGVAKILAGVAERLRHYERLTNDAAQDERGKRW